ncbi:hypothetical protein RSAG8_09120, partial [Rhizoctonia solani AG-8 WAC10335]
MIEQLRSAGAQLRAAWDTYCRVYSTLQSYDAQIESPHAHGFPPELTRQLDIELAFISSYETKIKVIKVTIGRARNYLSGVAPINTLPSEIMTRILHLIREHPCSLHRRSASKSHETQHPSYPGYLAQVCALWRNTAISSSSLWCHIDLSPCQPRYNELVARAETYLTRAGGLLIELHIAGDEDHRLKRADQGYNDLYELISRISSRVETLELAVTKVSQGFICTALRRLLLGQHLRFKKLVIRSEFEDYNDTFISAEDVDSNLDESDDELADFRLDLTEEQIESSFAHLTILHLCGIFPAWSSAAYSGLVDLRLMSGFEWSHITEDEFVTILKSSPTLQILHFGIELYEPTNTVTPVNLQDLQVVKIFTEDYEGMYQRPARLLRLLAPGLKPLRLSISGHFKPGTIFDMEMEQFFARSRMERFHTQVLFPAISLLLRQAAHLEQFVLDDFKCYNWDEPPSTWLGPDGLASLPRLGSLHIIRSSLLEDQLRLLVEYCPTGVVLYSCDVQPH